MDSIPSFGSGENRIIRAPSTILVIFGVTGDLAQRKLLPALYNLSRNGHLPGKFIVLGCSRKEIPDDTFRSGVLESLKKHSRRSVDEKVWQEFSKQIYHFRLSAERPADFKRLRARLEEFSEEFQEDFNHLYYLSVSPEHFLSISSNLSSHQLIEPVASGVRRTSVIVEKPIGDNFQSARELNAQLQQSFDERQIYRIDHYLGKETVQNILVFRFSNGIFEPLWNRHYIDHIQITVAETVGVENRAAYFDQTGIVRDIVQSHLLQVLALLCIEPPISLSDADAIRDEKVKVLRSIKRLRAEEISSSTVRAQYRAGFISGERVSGYLEEPGVAAGSQVETYAALRLYIDNWRWHGVPIYVRTGKRLPKRITEITVHFKEAPLSLFQGRQVGQLGSNILAIQVQPREGISLLINSKPPGPRLRAKPVVMNFQYNDSFGTVSPEAYERLLLDAMRGEATLFTRSDEVEHAWQVLDPILEYWQSAARRDLAEYEAGSWGPLEAENLISATGHRWRKL